MNSKKKIPESPDNDAGSADADHFSDLISSRRITRNSILNIIGYCAPILVALVAIPVIIREMGTERFGILTLAWAMIGYFSLFDFGLNRALTKLVAEKLGAGEKEQIPHLIWTSLVVMGILGCSVTALLILLLPFLIDHVLTIPPALKRETTIAFYLLVLSLPLIIVSVGLRGVLSAYQKFAQINYVRVPMGIYLFLAPIPVIKWYLNELHPVLAVLILGRLVGMLVQLRMCQKTVPFLQSGIGFRREWIRPLLSFGGWVTVCNLISPLMIYIDRFFISAMISASAVAYYATPNEAATKIWYLPWALMGVLFPAFSTTLAKDNRKALALYENSMKYLFVVMFPLVLLAITFSYEGLDLWLGSEFSQKSTVVLKWMVVGVFFHSLAQVLYALIQGAGKPDIIAKLHMIELPIYCILLWQLITLGGTQGAAIAWTIRLGADGLILLVLAGKILPGIVGKINLQLGILAMVLVAFFLTSRLENIFFKTGFCLAVIVAFGGFVWFLLFNKQDRDRISKGILNAI